jgi:hypothetical protein
MNFMGEDFASPVKFKQERHSGTIQNVRPKSTDELGK